MLTEVEAKRVIHDLYSTLRNRIREMGSKEHAAAGRHPVGDGAGVVGDTALGVPADALPVPPDAEVGVVDEGEGEDDQDGDGEAAEGGLKGRETVLKAAGGGLAPELELAVVDVGDSGGQEDRDQEGYVGEVLEVTVVVTRAGGDPAHKAREATGQGEGYALIAADGQRAEQGQGQRGPEEGAQEGFKRVGAAGAEQRLKRAVARDEAVGLQAKGQFHVGKLAVAPGVAELAVEVAGDVDKLWQGPDEQPGDSGGAQDCRSHTQCQCAA